VSSHQQREHGAQNIICRIVRVSDVEV
jgi:hypothetical protein